jgi:myo-inositol 2-dehydrogenase/D-chiro-inositol 1-dehydrogenase
MRVAFVGAGAIARTHIGILADTGLADVVAVCDPAAERASAAAAACGAAAYAEWEPMLDAERPDAVFVCTPPAHHAPPALGALRRGIPAYLEKPLARTLAAGLAIAAGWEKSGCVCAVGYQWRSLETVAAARAALQGSPPGLLVSRSLGPTEPARADLAAGAGSWFADPRQSGGVLFELGSHDIDLQLALAGRVDTVQATAAAGRLALAGRPADGLHDAVSATLRFCDGGIGAVHVGWTAEGSPPVYTLDVLAADVSLALVLDPVYRLHGRAHGGDVDVTDRVDARRRSVERFFAAVERGDPEAVACTPRDALRTLAVALACETAIATEEIVRVPRVAASCSRDGPE